MVGHVFRKENYLRLAGKSFHVGGVSQAPGADITLDDLGKILFVKGNVPLSHLHHAGTVRVAAGDGRSKIRQTG